MLCFWAAPGPPRYRVGKELFEPCFVSGRHRAPPTIPALGYHVFCDTFATPALGDHVFCDTFATPALGDHVFCDTFTIPALGYHVFCDTLPTLALQKHVFCDTFATPALGSHVFYDTFASPALVAKNHVNYDACPKFPKICVLTTPPIKMTTF